MGVLRHSSYQVINPREEKVPEALVSASPEKLILWQIWL